MNMDLSNRHGEELDAFLLQPKLQHVRIIKELLSWLIQLKYDSYGYHLHKSPKSVWHCIGQIPPRLKGLECFWLSKILFSFVNLSRVLFLLCMTQRCIAYRTFLETYRLNLENFVRELQYMNRIGFWFCKVSCYSRARKHAQLFCFTCVCMCLHVEQCRVNLKTVEEKRGN